MDRSRFAALCLSLPAASSDFPFDEVTEVFRVRGRIFALCATDQPGPPSANLKCDPDLAADLRLAWPGVVVPGWHMNHRHWNTLRLEGGIPDAKIEWMIRHSWERVVAGLPRKEREGLETGTEKPSRRRT
jgi:predicted DNA-binding protein (MmcQ/YjbR family)